MTSIPISDPRHAAAKRAMDAMHELHDLDPWGCAVRWIEDTDGRLIVFTRGECKEAIKKALAVNLSPEEYFELEGDDNDQ